MTRIYRYFRNKWIDARRWFIMRDPKHYRELVRQTTLNFTYEGLVLDLRIHSVKGKWHLTDARTLDERIVKHVKEMGYAT